MQPITLFASIVAFTALTTIAAPLPMKPVESGKSLAKEDSSRKSPEGSLRVVNPTSKQSSSFSPYKVITDAKAKEAVERNSISSGNPGIVKGFKNGLPIVDTSSQQVKTSSSTADHTKGARTKTLVIKGPQHGPSHQYTAIAEGIHKDGSIEKNKYKGQNLVSQELTLPTKDEHQLLIPKIEPEDGI